MYQRIVPVKLIAGKKYVLRNGRQVIVKDNPHWQCAAKYPFVVIQGSDLVYLDEEGNTGGGTAHEHDIIRPVYKEGETYLDGYNNRVTITRVDAHVWMYPVHGDDGGEYMLDGKYLDEGSDNSENNLFDYVHKAVDAVKHAPPFVDLLREEAAASADLWIGKRVKFNQDGESGTGIVRGFNGKHYAVEVDEWCTEFSEGHRCGGLVPSGCGWYVHPLNLTAIDGVEPVVPSVVEPVVPSIVHDVSPDLPILATPVTPLRVGMRVEVQLDCGTTGLGVITYEAKDGTCAVEFEEGTGRIPSLHDCDGHVPSGCGWWCHNDTIRAVSEAETQVEAERSDAEALNEADVAEVWAAYRINPSISIDAWIAARRVLKAAAK